ncbi:MAG: ATP-binding protein [Gemmatimonadota bacterium]
MSANTARWVGLMLLTFAVIGVVGWVTGTWWMVQPLRSFPPLRFASALGLLALGAGIFVSPFPRQRPQAVFWAISALVLGTLPLQHALGIDWLWEPIASVAPPVRTNWHGEPVGQMALSSAVFVALGAIGLLAIVSRHRGLWSSIALAATGGIVMLLATTVVAGQAMGFLEGVQYGAMLGSSLQATLCAIVFATHFNALAWTKQSGFAPPPAWLPLSVGAGSLVTVLFLWRALVVSEAEQLADQTRVAAGATRLALARQLSVAERALDNIAVNSESPNASWTAFASRSTSDIDGLEGIVWTDSSGVRRGSDTLTTPTTLAAVVSTLRTNAAMLRESAPSRRFVPLDGDSSRALLVTRHCDGARCGDRLVGVINAPQLLGAVLADTVLGVHMAIGNRDRWFRTSAPAPEISSRFLVIEPVTVAGLEWQLGVWPNARTMSGSPSRLSDFVLLLGIAVSVLLAVALRLAQSVSQSARLEERASIDKALQSTTDGLWEWDLLSGVVTRSPQLWGRLGYGSGQAHSRMQDWLGLVHPQDRVMVENRLTDHLESRADAFDAQYRVKSAAGRWHDFVDRGRVVLRSPTGQPLRLLGMFADVTDRRHAEESLRQAETMSTMGRLAARIAHEINNPLAGIQSAFLLIKDAIPPTHPHIKYVGAIEREVQRISQVTRQLYETYRPETESSTHAPVQTVVGDAVAFLEQVNRNAGVSISVELGGVAAVVRLSDSILRQCIYNLVQNAIEASPPGSRVVVSGAIVGREFVLRVRDQGPGVPSDLRESIFDPFVSTKPSQLSTGGMGLGLSLVRRAVDAAGGSIEVIDADGGGAEFIARIPLADPPVNGVSA